MKFDVYINDPIIQTAAFMVERHYNALPFMDLLLLQKSFNLTQDTGRSVGIKLWELKDHPIKMKIKPYKTWSPWSKVIGYAKGDTIYVNTRKLDLPLKDRVENFMHEPLHLLGYSHKGNSNNEFNRGTVPYKVASLFVTYLESIGKL